MIELHVPTEAAVKAVASVVGHITDGLDAVVVAHDWSSVYEGHIHLTLAGNARDLATATRRAEALGGKVD